MNKLMIAVAIVCAAAMSQAATCVWNFQTTSKETLYGSDLSTEYTGAAYAFMVTADLTQQDVINKVFGLAGETKTDLGSISGTKFELAAEDGVIPVKSHKGYTTTGTGSNNQDWFLAIVQGDKLYIGDASPWGETTLDTGTTVKFDVEDTSSTTRDGTTFTAGGWYAAAVPEPTSGLLLLLGVAGLALRRRRA